MSEQVQQQHERSVRLGNKRYTVTLADTYISASVYNYTLGGNYGNGYGDEYIVYRPARKYAKVVISSWNNTFACRGHGMNDSWAVSEVVDASAAREFIEQVKQEFNAITEDADVRTLALKIRDFVKQAFNNDDYCDDD